MNKPVVAASIICADLNNIGQVMSILNRTKIGMIHFDVMDGQFVPGFGLSEKHLIQLRSITDLPIEVHLMTVNPESHIDIFSDAGADIISVHQEVCPNLHRTIQKIRMKNKLTGVVLNPGTSIMTIKDILHTVDIVTLMSIDPGLIGSEFLPFVKKKITDLIELFKKEKIKNPPRIQVDGGLDKKLADEVADLGCDIVVHGFKSIFSSKEELEININSLLENNY